MKPIIQIAGIIDQQEADMVLNAGATHLGFPLRLDVHKEDLSEQEAAQIIHSLPNPKMGVLITYLNSATAIVDLVRFLGCKTIQLHGSIEIAEIKAIRAEIQEIQIWKSLIVKQGNFMELQKSLNYFESFVDAFITDTFDSATEASGATGKIHDWDISKRIVEQSIKPVILAGGLNPENVFDAIVQVQPAGVDAHTGLENPDSWKDLQKCREFIAEAKRGFQLVLNK